MQLEKGILVVTGEGKGKTTTALGTALKFLGAGKKVCMLQFLKGSGFSGELFVDKYFGGNFFIKQFGGSCRFSSQIREGLLKCQKCGECFRESKNPGNDFARQAMQAAFAALEQNYALLILDEVSHALKNELLAESDLRALLAQLPEKTLLVLTGRSMPQWLLSLADYAVECWPAKHPKEQGIDARRGVEY